MTFEELLSIHLRPVERYVRFRVPEADAEDVLQEVLTAAFRAFPELKDVSAFKPWLLGIARYKCLDQLRRKYRLPVPVECVPPGHARLFTPDTMVEETLDKISENDAQLLRMCYFDQLPLSEMALRLNVPVGTVKSRLHAARRHFRDQYPTRKDDQSMKHTMPDYIPAYTITQRTDEPFSCKWEECMGFFVVPKIGEKLTWAMYDDPDGHRTEVDHLCVTGRAAIHGIEGVEITVETSDAMENNQIQGATEVTRTFVAQLTNTHCRFLAETHVENGVKRMFTFLDGDEFLNNWGFGEDNCGNETNLRVKGDILRRGSAVTHTDRDFLLDVVGRYDVAIAGKVWDTVCVMDVSTYVDGMATEQYINRSGRTVLWRRFNRDDWRFERYGRRWSEMLPDSERITVNGETYVHWYDCITDYILK